MSSAFLNRLVGTIIVVALIVIFVPEFLDGEKRINQPEFMDIPPVSDLVEVEPIEDFNTETIENTLVQPVAIIDETALDDDEQDNDDKQDNDVNTDSTVTEQVKDTETRNAATDTAANTAAANLTGNSAEQVPSDTQISESQQDTPPPANTDTLSQIEIKDSGWVVQLGSFRHQKNVRELVKKLNDAGYRVYTRPAQTAAGELTKVFVGPELEREKLELALPHLKEVTKLTGKITAFEVSAG